MTIPLLDSEADDALERAQRAAEHRPRIRRVAGSGLPPAPFGPVRRFNWHRHYFVAFADTGISRCACGAWQ